MTCPRLEQITDMELNHETEYTEAFYNLTEETQENLTNVEEKQYIQNQDSEDIHTDKIRTLKGNHFKTCTDSNCQRLKGVWANEESLKGYVQ